jgi:hypothetical protein
MKDGRRHDEVKGSLRKSPLETLEIANLESDVREFQPVSKFPSAHDPLLALINSDHLRCRIQSTVETRQNSVITAYIEEARGLWEFLSAKPTQELFVHLVVVLSSDIDAECQRSILQWVDVNVFSLFSGRNRMGNLLRDRAVLLLKPLPEGIPFQVAADTH